MENVINPPAQVANQLGNFPLQIAQEFLTHNARPRIRLALSLACRREFAALLSHAAAAGARFLAARRPLRPVLRRCGACISRPS
jgi:hypothetical protein